jgi:hypothetical protein
MEKKIVVTVCTAGYLAHAKGLADSVIKYNPGYEVVMGLVDKLDDDFDISIFNPHRLLQVHEMNLPLFEEMRGRYNIFELNCSLKSFFVRWVLDKYAPDFAVYLDVDMLVFDSFSTIENMLTKSSILITPHIFHPFPVDNFRPQERDILKTGIFNAGFFAVKNDDSGNAMINWWKDRMADQGYERPKDGYNADQNWLNFVPIYFKNVNVVRNAGFNAAYWNLHERKIEKKGDKYMANNDALLFFHYSGYSTQQPDMISRHQDRFSMKENPALTEIFQLYLNTLKKNGYEKLRNIPCYYEKKSSANWLKKLGFKK